MDIYSVLASKPHNPHYLNRYISFITKCQQKNIGYEGYMEKHHVCPKAKDMFPEYDDLNMYPWNNAKLTPRQHFIAHMILWKMYFNNSQAFAFWAMKHRNKEVLNSRIYEKLKEDIREKISCMNAGKMWVNDGSKSKVIHKSELEIYIIDRGWYLGRIFSKEHKMKISANAKERYKDPTKNPRYKAEVALETRKKISEKNSGKKMNRETKDKISSSIRGSKKSEEARLNMKREKGSEIFITDGASNRRVKTNAEMPSGWWRGITR